MTNTWWGVLYWVTSKQNERWATQAQPTEPLVKCYKGNNTNRNTKNCVFPQEPVLSIFQQRKSSSFYIIFEMIKIFIYAKKKKYLNFVMDEIARWWYIICCSHSYYMWWHVYIFLRLLNIKTFSNGSNLHWWCNG